MASLRRGRGRGRPKKYLGEVIIQYYTLSSYKGHDPKQKDVNVHNQYKMLEGNKVFSLFYVGQHGLLWSTFFCSLCALSVVLLLCSYCFILHFYNYLMMLFLRLIFAVDIFFRQYFRHTPLLLYFFYQYCHIIFLLFFYLYYHIIFASIFGVVFFLLSSNLFWNCFR